MENFLIASALAEGETAAPEPTWLQTVFAKFGEISLTTWIALIVILLLGLGLWAVIRQKNKWTARMLAYAALSVALSFVLSYIRLWKMPQGGSITPGSMLPLLLFAYTFGAGPGILAGAVYGILQFIQDSWMLNIWQFLLDYPIAFGMMGVAGLFRGRSKTASLQLGIQIKVDWMLLTGIAIASVGRFVASTLSGVVFFAEYAPEGVPPLLYSIGYNGTYMLPELIICLVIALLAGPQLLRAVRGK